MAASGFQRAIINRNHLIYWLLIANLLALFFPAVVQAKTLHGRVIGVSDGDTITILKKRKPYKIRLYGIDCPEKKQAFGAKAKQYTSGLAFGQEVEVEIKTKDRYRRYVGIVTLPDGLILNHELLKQGLAWHYRRYDNDSLLQTLEDQARKMNIGIWSQPLPEPPWEFRRKKVLRPSTYESSKRVSQYLRVEVISMTGIS